VARRILERLGLEVQEAAEGVQAVAIAAAAAASAKPFDVALLDFTIPGGQGAGDIDTELRRVSPTTRLVLSSGYTAAAAEAGRWDAMLEKPYTLDQVRNTLNAVRRSDA